MGMRSRRLLKSWEKSGRFGPPHIVKQRMVLEHAKIFRTDTLIETGTYLGDMVYAMKDRFKDIYSIELSEDLYNRAKLAFKRYSHVHLLQGDSAEVLPGILDNVSERCLFWLDGHYSAGITALGNMRSPVKMEIEAILGHSVRDHVILIDDAICFDGSHGYPTLFELRERILDRLPNYEMSVFDNVIRINPSN